MTEELDIIEYLERVKEESKRVLNQFIEESDEAYKHYPTIEKYREYVMLSTNIEKVRIYDLALYDLTKLLLENLKDE
tara:strand:- start:109 stop:339 length:231 start_codon:yes stop_codon:yes gene_type:complete